MLIDVDDLGVGRCSKDVLPAAYCAGWNGLLGLIEKAPTVDAVIVTRCEDCVRWDDDPDTYGADDGPKGKCMDRVMAQIIGGKQKLRPFPERYHELRKVTYGR